MLQGILILLFMLFIMGLMVTRKMPTVLALFVLAVGICIIGGVPAVATDADGNSVGFLQTVMQAGVLRLRRCNHGGHFLCLAGDGDGKDPDQRNYD